MSNRIDNVRLVLFLNNKANNHNHLENHKRPMLSPLFQVTSDITLKAGDYYLPGLFANTVVSYRDDRIVIEIMNDTSKPVMSGGVDTRRAS